MSPSRRRFVRIAWCITLVAVIVGELLPGGSLPMRALSVLHINDKVEHFTGYATLAFLPAICEKISTLVLLAVGVGAMGVLLEFAQRLTATRTFDTADMLANAAGVCAGALLGLLLRPAVN